MVLCGVRLGYVTVVLAELLIVPLESITHEPVALPVVHSWAANSSVGADGVDKPTDILQVDVEVEVPLYIYSLLADTICDQVMPQPDGALVTVFPFEAKMKKVIKSPTLVGVTDREGVRPEVLTFQLLTNDIAILVTWLAQELKTSWLELLGLVAKHWPGAGVVVGRVKVYEAPGADGAAIVIELLLPEELNVS